MGIYALKKVNNFKVSNNKHFRAENATLISSNKFKCNKKWLTFKKYLAFYALLYLYYQFQQNKHKSLLLFTGYSVYFRK